MTAVSASRAGLLDSVKNGQVLLCWCHDAKRSNLFLNSYILTALLAHSYVTV